jgi:hypothetical protein
MVGIEKIEKKLIGAIAVAAKATDLPVTQTAIRIKKSVQFTHGLQYVVCHDDGINIKPYKEMSFSKLMNLFPVDILGMEDQVSPILISALDNQAALANKENCYAIVRLQPNNHNTVLCDTFLHNGDTPAEYGQTMDLKTIFKNTILDVTI